MRAHPIAFCWRGVGSGEDGRLTVAVGDLLPSSDQLWRPNGGDGADEGHAGVGAAGMVQEADDREEGCGKAHLLGVGDEALFRSSKSKRRKGKMCQGIHPGLALHSSDDELGDQAWSPAESELHKPDLI